MTEEKIAKAKAGGKKGDAIVALLAAEPALSRKELAARCGATTGRVGEVIRHLARFGTKEQQNWVTKHIAAQPPRVGRPPVEVAPQPAKRSRGKAS